MTSIVVVSVLIVSVFGALTINILDYLKSTGKGSKIRAKLAEMVKDKNPNDDESHSATRYKDE